MRSAGGCIATHLRLFSGAKSAIDDLLHPRGASMVHRMDFGLLFRPVAGPLHPDAQGITRTDVLARRHVPVVRFEPLVRTHPAHALVAGTEIMIKTHLFDATRRKVRLRLRYVDSARPARRLAAGDRRP